MKGLRSTTNFLTARRRGALQRYAGVGALALGALIGACDDEDPMDPDPPAEATFTLRIENVSGAFSFLESGVFNVPNGAVNPGPIGPGGSYSFEVTAPEGSSLSLATMFVPSNDLFFAPDGNGISLYDATGTPISGDVTSSLMIWDAGTELNEEPGLGPNQVQRQAGPDTGADDSDTTVRLATDDFGNLPAVEDVIQVDVAYQGSSLFMVTITNVSDAMTLTTSDAATQAVPLSPGVFVVHSDPDPLFTVGEDDREEGLEAIAEDGDPSALDDVLDAETGITVPLSPGVFAVYTDDQPIFMIGSPDAGEGLEAIAEDGSPAALAAALAAKANVSASGVFNTPVGSTAPSAIVTGGAYEFTFTAQEGERLTFATMFVESNDLFYSVADGIELFSGGVAASGDVTAQVGLYDAGTEVNEYPGIGPNQVQRQAGPDTGEDEDGSVQTIATVNDGFTYPDVSDVLRVTLMPGG